MGYGWVLADGILAGIECVCAEPGLLLKELGTIEAASYLFVPALAFVFFKEKINLRKVAAIALILAGVVVFFWE